MRLFKYVLIGLLLGSLAGCSSLANWYNGDDDYRKKEAQLAKELEMPPNFIQPQSVNPLLTQQVADLSEVEQIPSYQVDGLRVQSNLSERWLEISDQSSKDVWRMLMQFLATEGFSIKEQRLDIGLIETDFLPRKQVAPVELEEGTLSRLFNSWRPELASGIYDRFTLKVEQTDGQTVKVFIRHHMMQADSSGETGTSWKVRPYDPMIESIALYKTMIFMGATQQGAIEQIESAKLYQEIYEGEEFSSVLLAAGRDQAWQYIQSLIYRANWTVESQSPALYQVWVKAKSAEPKGFFARLFASGEQQLVRIALQPYEKDTAQTEVSLSPVEGQPPLTAEQKQQLFRELGLLEK